MKRTSSGLCIVAALLFTGVSAQAQDTPPTAAKASDAISNKGHSYTGCIEAGTTAGTFVLTHITPDAKVASDNAEASATMSDASKAMSPLALTGSAVDLAPHVGHKVTVTGTMTGKMKNSETTAGGTPPVGGPQLSVKVLTMVAPSCE